MKRDDVDAILDQWRSERPNVDLSGMAIIARISRLDRMIEPVLSAVFSKHGLESWEFDVLATLRRSGRPFQLTAGQLLTSMMIASGTVTNRIDRLATRGLVERVPSATDRRQVFVKLTKRGVSVVEAALIDHTTNEARLVAALTPAALRRLEDGLRDLTRAIAEAELPSA